jgi:putative DNA primase/helicase
MDSKTENGAQPQGLAEDVFKRATTNHSEPQALPDRAGYFAQFVDEPEKAVIQIVLSSPIFAAAVHKQFDAVKSTDFKNPAFAAIYGASGVLRAAKKKATREAIADELRDWQNDDDGNGNRTRADLEAALQFIETAPEIPVSEKTIAIAKTKAKEIKDRREAENPPISLETDENMGLIGLIGSYPDTFENFLEEPQRITAELRSVPSLPIELIPEPLRAWLADIAARVSCPLEYVAAPAIISAATAIGRKVGARPKQRDSWTVAANLWGATVGTPGAKKTPAASEARLPLRRLSAEAREVYEAALNNFDVESQAHEYETKAAKAKAEKAAKGGASRADLMQMIATGQGAEPATPTLKRYEVNDATIEALGERLKENPNGLLIYRDELTGFIKSLDRQGHENDRAFYLEAWNGLGEDYTYDRIGRGTIRIPFVCVSIFGTIQPAPLAKLLRGAANGSEADGFIPRFQMLLYPDPTPYRFIDRYPDTDAKNRAFEIYKKLDEMTAEELGAEVEEGHDIPFLRFSLNSKDCDNAQEFLNKWVHELETERLPASQDTPLIESHLAKFRSLMPKLALIFHLVDVADGQAPGAITLKAARLAAVWCDLLEAHARRVYSLGYDTPIDSALALAEKIKNGELGTLKSFDGERFKASDIVRKGWASLSTTEEVLRAIAILEERHWLQTVETPPTPQGGRRAEWVYIHPKFAKSEGGEAK